MVCIYMYFHLVVVVRAADPPNGFLLKHLYLLWQRQWTKCELNLFLIRAKFKLVFLLYSLLHSIRGIKNHKYCDILYDLFIIQLILNFFVILFIFLLKLSIDYAERFGSVLVDCSNTIH